MSKKINSYKAMSVLTRGFFEAFANGIIDCQIIGNDFKKKHNPQNIKQAMLEHYEEISAHFLDIMFPALARLNYPDEKKMQEKLKKEFTDKQADMAQYLRFACKTDKLYEAMVNEYKRNFNRLLQGQFTLVRVLLKAYAAGIKASKTAKRSFNQVSIYRMLLLNTQLLMNDSSFKSEEEDLMALFKEACGNEANLNVLFNSLDETYKELVKEDGIIAGDEQSN